MENNSMTLLTDLINDADFIYMNTNEDSEDGTSVCSDRDGFQNFTLTLDDMARALADDGWNEDEEADNALLITWILRLNWITMTMKHLMKVS